MAAPSTYKLGLLAHKKKFPRMPEQHDDTVYGIVWGLFGKDARESCYLVRFVQKAQVELLAYVNVAGEVFKTAEPASSANLPQEPDMQLILDEGDSKNGMVTVKGEDGILRMLCYFDGSPEGTMRERSESKTWNSTRSMVYGEFMASMFLRYVILAARPIPSGADGVAEAAGATGSHDQLQAEKLDEPVELFAGFDVTPLGDSVEALLYRLGKSEHSSGLELFAKRLLGEAKPERLATIAARGNASLANIERTQSFYINYDPSSLDQAEADYLISFETALNRLRYVLEQMGAGLQPATMSPSESGCSLIDQVGFTSTTGLVATLLKHAGEENPFNCPGTVTCKPGGEWDVRTRFAAAAESMNVMTRLDYTYDSNAAEGVMAVRFMGTRASQLPLSAYDQTADAWCEFDGTSRALMAQEHDARIAVALAAAAFCAGASIKACYVGATDPMSEAQDLRAVYGFERGRFMAEIVPLAERLNGVSLAGQPCFGELKAHFAADDLPEVSAPDCRAMPRDDTRELPPALRDLLLADRASELEVMEQPDDPYTARLVELRDRIPDDPQGAAEGLAKLVEELEAACTVQELVATGPVQSQFCENQLGRIVFPVLESDRSLRILRAPDALYFAQFELCNMFAQHDDFERALPEARKLYDVARTSMQAHYALINVLAHLERFEEIIEVARHGLRIATDRESIGYLFYRLAFAYWNCDKRELALACYRLVPRGEHISASAEEELQGLMFEMGIAEPPTFNDAVETLERSGLNLPPTPRVRAQIADAAVLLTDNGFYYLAVRCVYQMWRTRGSDELGALNRSLAGKWAGTDDGGWSSAHGLPRSILAGLHFRED